MFSHTCRKTNRQVRIEVLDPTARKLLDRDFSHGEYMFLSHRTGKPFEELQLSGRFGYIRSKTPGYGSRKLKMRCIRHSAILEFAKAHCTIAEIRSVTGHSIRTVHRVLDTYMPGHDVLASSAAARRQNMRLHGQTGELIVENKRRLWLADLPQAPKPLSPREIARGAGR